MRSGIGAQSTRYLMLGSALLSLVFAACSLNPQPIPPGAKSGDAGFGSSMPSPRDESGAGTPDAGVTTATPSDASARDGDPTGSLEGGANADGGDSGDAGLDASDPDADAASWSP